MVIDLIKHSLKQNYNQELASLNGDLLINYAYFLLALFVGHFNLSPILFLEKDLMNNKWKSKHTSNCWNDSLREKAFLTSKWSTLVSLFWKRYSTVSLWMLIMTFYDTFFYLFHTAFMIGDKKIWKYFIDLSDNFSRKKVTKKGS